MSGFNLGNAVNNAADWACDAPIIRGVVSNPVFTALLITALAAIVVMALYHYQIRRAGTKRAVRALLYVFLVVTAVTFVHHYAVTRIAREATQQTGVRDVFSSIQQSRDVGSLGAVPVYPLGQQPVAAVGGAEDAVGGAEDAAPACGCPNAAAYSPLDIEDVVLPAAASPFGSK